MCSDKDGKISVLVKKVGCWYVCMIYMMEDLLGEYDYFLQWVMLIFEVGG